MSVKFTVEKQIQNTLKRQKIFSLTIFVFKASISGIHILKTKAKQRNFTLIPNVFIVLYTKETQKNLRHDCLCILNVCHIYSYRYQENEENSLP